MWRAGAEAAATASSRGTAADRPSASPPSDVGSAPLFLRQMNRPLAIDITRALPAIARLVQPAPQRPGADRDALCGQVVRQQWHRRPGADRDALCGQVV